MKKPIITFILLTALTLTLAACGAQPAPTLTAADYLDLGEKYLLDLDYDQALVQFLKVIEIEPMNPRGYTGAAEAYVGLDRFDDAIAILEQGLTVLPDNAEIQDKLTEMNESEYEYDAADRLIGRGGSIYDYNADGSLISWSELEYDIDGKMIKFTGYNVEGSVMGYVEFEYATDGKKLKSTSHNAATTTISWEVYEHDADGKITKVTPKGDISLYGWRECEYDTEGKITKIIAHSVDGTQGNWSVFEYDAIGNDIKEIHYTADGSLLFWREYEFGADRNLIKITSYRSDGSISITSVVDESLKIKDILEIIL